MNSEYCCGRYASINTLENGLQVAELIENKELVGVIQGCIKCVNTAFGARNLKIGYILGLRVSPTHRYEHFHYFFCWKWSIHNHICKLSECIKNHVLPK